MAVTYDKISTRDAFGIALLEKAKEYDNLFAVGADTTKSMGCKPMAAEFPDRVINNGIAEQNMALIGAGIASCGGKAVIATYAPFASMRIAEQIRTFICYPNLDVKIISGLSGLSGNIEGVTHQGIEDVGMMRSIANLVVAVPADAASCVVMAREILDYKGPVYFRIGRGPVEKVFDESYQFKIGKANVLDEAGTDAAIICNGTAVARVLRAKELWEQQGIRVRIIEMPCVKPIDEVEIIRAAEDCGRIIVTEEHSVIGGLGSAVCEVVTNTVPVPVLRIGIDDVFTESGPHAELLDKYNLSPAHIAGEVCTFIRKKAA
ncbi:MAG: transketolase family protein [Eubacterium sp.]|nr:transketolase family protein [Eubacterium sp.]MBR0396674.1 transketolase family protein [Eubacterium sp.]